MIPEKEMFESEQQLDIPSSMRWHNRDEPKDVVLGYKTSLDAQMLDSKLPKQETLEEAMAANGYDFPASDNLWREGVQFGANWQAEKMYSEEEVRLMLSESFKASQEGYDITADDIIKQFKKD